MTVIAQTCRSKSTTLLCTTKTNVKREVQPTLSLSQLYNYKPKEIQASHTFVKGLYNLELLTCVCLSRPSSFLFALDFALHKLKSQENQPRGQN